MRRLPNALRRSVTTSRRRGVGTWPSLGCIALLSILLVFSLASFANSAASGSKIGRSSDVRRAKAPQDLIASMEAEAAQERSEPKTSKAEEPVYMTMLGFVGKLAVVAGLAYGTIYLLKRCNVQGIKRAPGQTVRVVENTSLAANRSLHVVQIGSKKLLVASTPSQVSLLTEIEEELAAEPLQAEEPPAPAPAQTKPGVPCFRDQLSSFLGNKIDTADTAKGVAHAIRSCSAFMQEKIMEVGRLRKGFRDA